MRDNVKRHSAFLVLLLLALTLTACVRQQQYRFVNIPSPGQLPAIEDHKDKGYKLAFVEFKDNGDPHDPQQAIKAEELIRTERKGSAAQWEASSVVLIYVHGWKNNANQAPPGKYKDVEKFKQTLEEIAPLIRPLPDGRPTPLVGVYIGWHGKSLELPSLLSWVSFWPRGIAAGRVGDSELTTVLNKLGAAAREGDTLPGINPKVVLVGHSFGSRVLEQAEKRRSVQLGQCKQLHESGLPVKPYYDLVLFVNAATGSSVTREMIEKCKPKEGSDLDTVFVRHPDHRRELCPPKTEAEKVLCRPYPLFVSISSRSDYATKFLLPFAAFRLSAAHTGSLNTHEVIELKPDQEIPEDNIFTFRSQFHSGKHLYAVTQKRADERVGPFWIMTVDKNVIANHGDIWNADFRHMLLNLMGQMQVVPISSPTYQRLPPKSKASQIQ
ncbi:MAG TPA: hypothetical protein VFF31_15510 [Blastocatellia bacterium]|nr:hypothetical protein [Blastocatellia bacterium]